MRPEFKFGMIGGLVLLVLGLGTYMSLKKPAEPLKNLPLTGPNATTKGAPGTGGAPPVRTPLDSPKPATPTTNTSGAVPPPSGPPATRPVPATNEPKSAGVSLSGAALNPSPGLLPQDTPNTRPSTIILPEVKTPPPSGGSEPALNPNKPNPSKPTGPGSGSDSGAVTSKPGDTSKPKVTPTRDDRGTNAPSPTPTPTQPKAGQYTIQPGDRLSDIAKDHYGDAGMWRIIKDANPGLDENRLMVGKTIVLPPKDAKPSSTSKATEKSKSATSTSAPAKKGATTQKVPTPTTASTGPKPNSPTAPPRTEKKPSETSKPAASATSKTSDSKPAKAAGTYTVAKSDTLRTIARKELGSDKRWREIYELNKDKIKNPDQLLEGTVLKLPAK